MSAAIGIIVVVVILAAIVGLFFWSRRSVSTGWAEVAQRRGLKVESAGGLEAGRITGALGGRELLVEVVAGPPQKTLLNLHGSPWPQLIRSRVDSDPLSPELRQAARRFFALYPVASVEDSVLRIELPGIFADIDRVLIDAQSLMDSLQSASIQPTASGDPLGQGAEADREDFEDMPTEHVSLPAPSPGRSRQLGPSRS